MTDQTDATLALWRRTAFVWGQTDCILSMCDHVLAVTGIDPAGPWRGIYSDEGGALALMLPFGGCLGLVTHGMALAGLPVIDAPVRGCPVVCDLGGEEVAGVFLGPRTAFRMPRGVLETRVQVIRAWGLE